MARGLTVRSAWKFDAKTNLESLASSVHFKPRTRFTSQLFTSYGCIQSRLRDHRIEGSLKYREHGTRFFRNGVPKLKWSILK